MKYRVTKTYGHERGLSVAFRQHKADHSHCHFVHGYALAIAITFEAGELDARGWVIDFGAMAQVKEWLDLTFDHVVLVAEDDPERDVFTGASLKGLMQVCLVPGTGCEAFARLVLSYVDGWLHQHGHTPRVRVISVDVSEHGANKATVISD